VFRCVLGSEGCVLVPRSSGTPVATWAWPTWVVSRRRVLEAVFILLEFPSPSRRIFSAPIHSPPPPLWFAVLVLHQRNDRREDRRDDRRCQDDHNHHDNNRKELTPPPPPKGGNPNGAFQPANIEMNFIVGGPQATKSNRLI
jgi:hypothetical protein